MKKMLKKYEEIIRYLIVGVLTTVVSLIIYYGLTLTILNPLNAIELQIANVISWIGAVLFAYFTNRKYVFQKNDKSTLKEFLSFTISRVGTLLVDMILMYLLVSVIKFNDKIAKLFVQFVVIVLNYILSKFFVFNKR